MAGESVIVSGAAGFVGSHLCVHLADMGYKVFALALPDEPIPDSMAERAEIKIVRCNLSEDCDDVVEQLPRGAKAFFHFAWAGVAPEARRSVSLQRGNVDMALRAVELARDLSAQRFVFPGSTLEYSYAGRPISRVTPPTPQDAYGAAKISARYFSELMCREYGICFLYTVISSIYSPDRLGSNVITYTISTLLAGEKPSLTRLEQLWDYVHIDDVVLALRLVMEKGRDHGFYAIGHGDNWPLCNYIYRIRDLIDPALPLGIGDIPYRDSVIPMSCVDLTELQHDTGFEPTVSFDEGVSAMIDIMREQMRGE